MNNRISNSKLCTTFSKRNEEALACGLNDNVLINYIHTTAGMIILKCLKVGTIVSKAVIGSDFQKLVKRALTVASNQHIVNGYPYNELQTKDIMTGL